MPPIKHLVISGGGTLGFQFLGALKKLNQEKYWNITDIESIYSTSIGSLIAVFLCLNYDWETLLKYVIERPWQEAFKIKASQIIDSYYKKGLYDTKLAEIICKPLFEAKDLTLSTTLKDLYEYSKIDLHIFTFNINNFETVELSHSLFPELTIVQAITMSCGLPGIFMPTMIDDCCYIDGGVMANYPINYCLRDHSVEEEILAFNSSFDNRTNNGSKYIKVNNETSLLEYIMCISLNSMVYISDSIEKKTINNTITLNLETNPLTLDSIKLFLSSQEIRKEGLQNGEKIAEIYLQGTSVNV